MHRLTDLRFGNTYARLHPAFYQVVDPTPLTQPRLVAFNPRAAELLDLDPACLEDPEAVRYLSGERRMPGAEPLAQAYAGHQFGVWVPELGDGRAFLLGEVRNAQGEKWDLHLKGGGRTRWSRFGDGRSVLRSAVREYLASEALHGLGLPTSRALCIVGSDEPVRRERLETAATLIRLAPSHVRFGTFQYFAARGETDRVRELADYVIAGHFPACADLGGPASNPARYRAFFGEVCRRTARMIAGWMAAGFAHGVMNTDNMSILGLTLDYGPFGFLDDYDPAFICNHTDSEGLYAFDRQPTIGMWNCARLGEALMALEGETPLLEAWQQELEAYWHAFAAEYGRRMAARLGLAEVREEDASLVRDLLALLGADRVDYTRFFRTLSTAEWADVRELFVDRPGIETWLARYRARALWEEHPSVRTARMLRINPKFVLRNWVAQEAIEHAERGDFQVIETLRGLLAEPFEEHPELARYAAPPSTETRDISVSCSS